MFCSNCGKEIKEGEKFCSNCGHNLNDDLNSNVSVQVSETINKIEPVTAKNKKVQGYAIASFVCGICSCVFGLIQSSIFGHFLSFTFISLIAIALSIIAVVFGQMSRKESNLGRAGWILGIISLSVIAIVFLVFFIIFLCSVFSSRVN